MLNHPELAARTGVPLADLNELIAGRVTRTVAERLGIPRADVQAFLNGEANEAMTRHLGLQATGAAVDLAAVPSRSFAIGIIVGLLLT